MLNSKEPMKVPHLQKLAKQLMLNGALIIKMINNSFTESRKTLVVQQSVERSNKKKNEIWAVKNIFLFLLSI